MQTSRLQPGLAGLLVLSSLLAACGWPAYVDEAEAGPDYAVQGEYASPGAPWAAQVIALGDGAFRAVMLAGGLPGAGWDGQRRVEVDGFRKEGALAVDFEGAIPARWEGGRLRVSPTDGPAFELARVVRNSPTEGAAPPEGATVLFDGEDISAFAEATLDERGWLGVPIETNGSFGDMQLHLEFRTPFMPTATGQMRGNSGVYLQGRYEIQVLDSFGLRGEDNECGGIYQVARPRVNMAFPPLQWQTYDIAFRAARFDTAGQKSENARVTVRHNGVSIHEDLEIPGPTGGGDDETPEPGPLLLQDHWNPVFYRNVWVVAAPIVAAD